MELTSTVLQCDDGGRQYRATRIVMAIDAPDRGEPACAAVPGPVGAEIHLLANRIAGQRRRLEPPQPIRIGLKPAAQRPKQLVGTLGFVAAALGRWRARSSSRCATPRVWPNGLLRAT